jgi:hypothetical protein
MGFVFWLCLGSFLESPFVFNRNWLCSEKESLISGSCSFGPEKSWNAKAFGCGDASFGVRNRSQFAFHGETTIANRQETVETHETDSYWEKTSSMKARAK